MHKPAIRMTMTTGDPRPLAIHPIRNMARASATFLEIVNEFRRRRLADAAPITVIANMTIVAAPVRMDASVVVKSCPRGRRDDPLTPDAQDDDAEVQRKMSVAPEVKAKGVALGANRLFRRP